MYNELLLPDLRIMLDENDKLGMQEFCEALHPAVSAEVLQELEAAEVWRVLLNCDSLQQAIIFEFIDLPTQIELVEAVDRKHLSRLIEAMAPDDRVDLLERMDPEHVEDLMPLIAQAERSDIRKLLSYPDESAGSIMTTEYASLPEDISVSEAIERLRQQAPDRETIYYVYILDEGRHLLGLISLRELILARPSTRLSTIVNRDVISVRVDDDQEFVAREISRYDFLAIPVVDNQNRLVGIVTHDDSADVLQEEATEDAHLLGAVAPLEDSYLSTPISTLAWKRGGWLLFLAVVALITAAVLEGYEKLSEKYVWMVWFLPLVLASGGNAGSQSATLVIRALAVGEMKRKDNFRIALREVALATILGSGLMILGTVAAYFFVGEYQGLVVGSTVFLVVMMGTISGAALPMFFHRYGMDPAMMSTPLIAAIVDVFGVIIYYTVAIIVLGQAA